MPRLRLFQQDHRGRAHTTLSNPWFRSPVVAQMAAMALGIASMGQLAASEMPTASTPSAKGARVSNGLRVEVAVRGLSYPTSIEVVGNDLYIAEGGVGPGDDSAKPRILKVTPDGRSEIVVTEGLRAPVNDLLWHDGTLYIAHRGTISRLTASHQIENLVTGLPSDGDHQTNQLTVGPDGWLYVGQGTVTNSGVVGYDNEIQGWLGKHPDLHDQPAHDVHLVGQTFFGPNPAKPTEPMTSQTGAFQPWGTHATANGTIPGAIKASGTILRCHLDGSGLEVYAWGLRNPYGLVWSSDGALYCSENGCDARGVRPIANDPEDLYIIKSGAWYGWPDFGSGVAFTDPRFKVANGPPIEFLMSEHPPVEKPLMTFPKHASVTKLDVSPGGHGGVWGERGDIVMALFGHMAPITGELRHHGGHRVVLIHPATRHTTTMLGSADDTHSEHGGQSGGPPPPDADGDALNQPIEVENAPDRQMDHDGNGHGDHGHEASHEAENRGPRRPIDVRFTPAGDALYVVDFGVLTIDSMLKPMSIPHSGVIWRLQPADAARVGPMDCVIAP